MTRRLKSLIGVTEKIGSHCFEPDAIMRFARKYDPQPFHMDAAAARRSHFGALCASGWHTIAMWMAFNVRSGATEADDVEDVGPEPGFRNLKWPRPVYAGDTVTYSRTIREIRPVSSPPGWSVVVMRAEGRNQNGDYVVECDSTALIKFKAA